MNPVQPAQRLERPPQPAVVPADIDSAEDEETDTSTAESSMPSAQFRVLPWHISDSLQSGGYSPATLTRGFSPSSSGQPTLTPESSLTVWSGANVMHYGGKVLGGHDSAAAYATISAEHGSGLLNATTTSGNGNGASGANWTSASRDMATFDLLRANSGRAGGGSSTAPRLRRNSNPQNAGLTEENLDFLRRVPSARKTSARAAAGPPSARPPRPHPTAAGVAPAAQPERSAESPPRHSVKAAVAAFNKRWATDSPKRERRERRLVSPVRLDSRAGATAAIAATTEAEDDALGKVASRRRRTVTPLTADAARTQPPSSEPQNGHDEAPTGKQSDAVQPGTGQHSSPIDRSTPQSSAIPTHTTTAAAPNTTAAASPDEIPTVAAPSQRRPPLPPLLADLHAAAQPPSPCASSSSPSTATASSSVSASGRASRGPAGSVDGRRRRTPSRHQAQVLFDDAAATPPQPPATVVAAADTAGEPVSPALVASSLPSGDAAAAATATPATAPPAQPSTGNGVATRRRAASTGRKPTTVIAAAPGDSTPPAGGNSSGGGCAAAATGAAVTSPPAPSPSTSGQTAPPTGPASTPPRTMEASPLKLTGAKRAPAAGAAGKSGGVPAPPSHYTSAGRLVQAARRRTVTSPLDAGLPKPSSTAPAPKPTTRSGCRSGGAKANAVQPTGSTSPPSDRPISAKRSAVAATHRVQAPEAQGNGQAAVAAVAVAAAPGTVNADRDVCDMNSLVSCSVHTIPPEKVQQAGAAEEPPQPQPQQSSLVEPTASAVAARSQWQQTASLQPAALGAAADARASDGAPTDALNVTTTHPTRVTGGGEHASMPQQRSVKEADGVDAAPLTPPRVAKDAPPLESVSPASRTVRSNPPLSPPSGAAIADPFGRHAPVVQLGREGLSPSPTKSWEAPRKVPPLPPADRTRSASPKGSDDSLTGPPSPTRSSRVGASRRGLAGASSGTLGGPSRRSFTTMGGRSSANASREWTLNGSIECPLSVTSTQAPLSVRLPNSSLHWPHSGPQTLNTRSSSADTSDRGERDMSFGSSLSTSADPSTAEAAASVTHTMLAATLCAPLVPFAAAHTSTSAAAVGAAQHACPPPPPAPSVAREPSAATTHDGPLSQSPGHPNQQGGAEAEAEKKQSAEHNLPTATEADALPAALAPSQPLSQPQQQQQLRALLIESAAPSAAATSPRLLVSPPTSTPPTAALRARRATLTVQGSMERLDLTERRPSAPLPVDRHSVGSAATAKSATVSPALRPMRRSIEKAVNSPGLTSPVLQAASSVPAGAAGTAAAATATTLMMVGGRQLPRMFPAADTTPPLSASTAQERAAAATAAPAKDKREKTKRQQPHAQDGSAARSGGDGNNPTTASANSDAGDGTDRGSRGAPQSPSGRRRARSVPANMLTRERQGGSATTPPLGVSPPPEFDGGLSLNTGTEAASRPRGEPPHRLHSHLHGAPNRSPGGPRDVAAADGDGAGGSGGPTRAVRGSAAQLLPPTLHTASGGHLPSVSSPAEATDGAFQPSPLRLPALPRFARVPLAVPAADSPPCPPSDATGRAMATMDDVRHDSSGSGNLKDSNTAASGARPATGSKSAEEKPARLCDGNTSSIHSRADATQGEGSVNGETHEVPQAKRSANRTPRARQRAPSVYFCD